MFNSVWRHGLQSTQHLCPWDFARQEYWSGFPFRQSTYLLWLPVLICKMVCVCVCVCQAYYPASGLFRVDTQVSSFHPPHQIWRQDTKTWWRGLFISEPPWPLLFCYLSFQFSFFLIYTQFAHREHLYHIMPIHFALQFSPLLKRQTRHHLKSQLTTSSSSLPNFLKNMNLSLDLNLWIHLRWMFWIKNQNI